MQRKTIARFRTSVIGVALAAALLVVVWKLFAGGAVAPAVTDGKSEPAKVKVVRPAACGCCGNYIAYLKKKGFDVDTEFVNETDDRSKRFGIPEDLGSCHTAVVGGYVVEGHVPVEAIEKLLKDRPKIKGIALPGMPAGSPGMPGLKNGKFDVESFTDDGTTETFMKI